MMNTASATANVAAPPPPAPAPTPRKHRQTKDHLVGTPHPEWLEQMLASHQPTWDRVTSAAVFNDTANGEFPEESWRKIILEFWCVIEAFPKYMGLTLAKTTFGKHPRDYLAREWLIGNIRIESMHAAWFIDWARGHGITEAELLAHRAGPDIGALHEWLFSVSHRGSLAQAVGAVNYAMEGTTGLWSRAVYPAFERRYAGSPEANRSLSWLKAHAKYDDMHPIEAMEIVKMSAHPHEYADIGSGILRTLELFSRALQACHTPRG